MKIIKGLEEIAQEQFTKTCFTLGKFDGVHIAHQKIIRTVVQAAQQGNAKSVVMTFDPLPDKKRTIANLEQKLQVLRELQVDYVILINPTEDFIKITAEDFIHSSLVEKFRISTMVTGSNFHFGYQKKGNVELLKRFASEGLFEYSVIDDEYHEYQRVSSSVIREFLSLGRLDSVNRMLDRNFSIDGMLQASSDNVVFKFNLNYTDVLSGAYLVSFNTTDRTVYAVGLLKNHIKEIDCYPLDRNLDLLSEGDIEVNLLIFLRPERHFVEREEIMYQVEQDIKAANYLVKNLFN